MVQSRHARRIAAAGSGRLPDASFGVPSALSSPGLPPASPPGRSRVEAPQSSPRFGVGHAPGLDVVAGPRPVDVFACCVPLRGDGAGTEWPGCRVPGCTRGRRCGTRRSGRCIRRSGRSGRRRLFSQRIRRGARRSVGVGVGSGCSATCRACTAGSGWMTSIWVGAVRSCGADVVTSLTRRFGYSPASAAL